MSVLSHLDMPISTPAPADLPRDHRFEAQTERKRSAEDKKLVCARASTATGRILSTRISSANSRV
jgi:hypothetical protein